MIKDNLNTQIQDALKKGDEIRVTTLRMLFTALTNAEIAKNRVALTADEEIKVVQQEAKKRSEAAEIYQKANETARADKEQKELEVLKEFLPESLSDQELEKIITDAIKQTGASQLSDMGKVIGAVMSQVAGRADGSRVSSTVKEKLA